MTINAYMTIDSLDSSTGGPARSVPCLGEAINKAGADVQLFINNKEGNAALDGMLPSTTLSIKPIKNLGEIIQQSETRESNNSLIHNHGIWLPINHYAANTAQRLDIPLVITPRGMLEPWARNYRSWKKTLAWILYQRRDLKAASLLHATSEREANNLEALNFQLPVALIPNGVEVPSLSGNTKSSNSKTVLFLGRIHPVKGLIDLVQALAKIRPTDWKVIIAGPDEGGHQAEVEHEILRHGLKDIFSFIGPVKDGDKWELYKSADLFVLPSHTENFGMVVAEALASGTPVITTKETPWVELKEHKCGWWIDLGVDPLVKSLKEAMGLAQGKRHAMGKRGKQLVEKKYSWTKIGNEMLAVYEWILGSGIRPGCIVCN